MLFILKHSEKAPTPIFETREGKIFACGKRNENVYLPTETIIAGTKFSILGNRLGVVFFGGDPLPNTPNKRILI